MRNINRHLVDAGLVTMKDSPNGKRYGHRNRQGQIVEAYGFDLSPMAARYAEFMQVAAEAKAEREMIGHLRRRATIARRAIAQILETALEYGFGDEEWPRLRLDSQALIKGLRRAERPEEITIAVGSLERRQTEARLRLEQLLDAMNLEPKPAENSVHTLPTDSILYPYQDTVVAPEACQSTQREAAPNLAPHGEQPEPAATQTKLRNGGKSTTAAEAERVVRQGDWQRTSPPRTDDGMAIRLSPEELTLSAPRLRPYLTSPRPTWPEIINAADWLRGDMGVSKSLWGEACLAMGREGAAIAIAIVSAKPAAHFRSTPGGYFHGMLVKAKAGELNLARTIWGLRHGAASKPRRGSPHSTPS